MNNKIISKKKIFFFLCILLAAAIAFIIYLKFLKGYRTDTFDCSYNSQLPGLTALIEKNFPGVTKTNVQLLAIFNVMPASDEIEIIGKIERKYKNRVNCFTLIFKKYKHKSQSGIAAKYYMKQRITCSKGNELFNKNFFLVLQDDRLVHSQQYFALADIVYLLEKQLNPAKTYADYAISKENLERKISTKIKAGNLRLYDLNAGEETFIERFSDTSKLYFIHATCSSCELRSLFSRVKAESFLDEERIIIIFSAMASVSDLSKLKKEMNIEIPIYIDERDDFDLLSIITNPKNNPVIIELGDHIVI